MSHSAPQKPDDIEAGHAQRAVDAGRKIAKDTSMIDLDATSEHFPTMIVDDADSAAAVDETAQHETATVPDVASVAIEASQELNSNDAADAADENHASVRSHSSFFGADRDQSQVLLDELEDAQLNDMRKRQMEATVPTTPNLLAMASDAKAKSREATAKTRAVEPLKRGRLTKVRTSDASSAPGAVHVEAEREPTRREKRIMKKAAVDASLEMTRTVRQIPRSKTKQQEEPQTRRGGVMGWVRNRTRKEGYKGKFGDASPPPDAPVDVHQSSQDLKMSATSRSQRPSRAKDAKMKDAVGEDHAASKKRSIRVMRSPASQDQTEQHQPTPTRRHMQAAKSDSARAFSAEAMDSNTRRSRANTIATEKMKMGSGHRARRRTHKGQAHMVDEVHRDFDEEESRAAPAVDDDKFRDQAVAPGVTHVAGVDGPMVQDDEYDYDNIVESPTHSRRSVAPSQFGSTISSGAADSSGSMSQQHHGSSSMHMQPPEALPVHAELVEDNEEQMTEKERLKIEEETRQRLMMQTATAQAVVVAEVPDGDDDEALKGADAEDPKWFQTKRARWMIGIALIVVVAIIAVVVAIATQSSGGGDGTDSPTAAPTAAPTALASNSPTAAPTTPSPSAMPSSAPTAMPTITQRPTTAEPSSVPSLEPTLGDNNFCESAHPVAMGFENRIIATLDETQQPNQFAQRCQIELELAARNGLWYRYEGENSAVTAQVTQGFSVHVFLEPSAVDPCAQLECDTTAVYKDALERVVWIGREGSVYRLLVLREDEALTGDGAFELSLIDSNLRENAYGNIQLEDGGAIDVPGRTHLGQSVDTQLTSNCDTASTPTAPGVWISVVGTGGNIAASTCGQATFDTQVTVVDESTTVGDTTVDLQCAGGNNDFCGTFESRVVWGSMAGVVYYILVHGAGNERGDFVLSIVDSGFGTLRDADFCTNALDADGIVQDAAAVDDASSLNVQSVDLSAATEDLSVPTDCIDAEIVVTDPSGYWYKVTGTGHLFNFVITQRGSSTPNDAMEVAVLTSDRTISPGIETRCEQLVCVAPSCIEGCQWPTSLGEVFYIFAYGAKERGLNSTIDFRVDVV